MKNKKEWTLMIYMIGDNNLSIDMVYALESIRKKVKKIANERINLFVYYENNCPDIPAIYCNFSDFNNPTYFYSNQIENKFSNARNYEIPNPKAIEPLIDFVNWCTKESSEMIYSMESENSGSHQFALIFSGHTMGFLSSGMFKEESTNVTMTMPSLQRGLQIITEEIIHKKISLIGFDSCVMSMFEVGYQFNEIAETMIASTGSVPNAGWSYSEILPSLSINKEKSVRELAADFVRKYITKQSNYSIGGVSVDMAAWDLTKVKILNKKIGKFAKTLQASFQDETSEIYQNLNRILLKVHFNCQTYMLDQNIDLGDFCTLLIDEIELITNRKEYKYDEKYFEIKRSAQEILTQIDKCIILSGYSGGEYQYSTGISMFFPWSLSAYRVSVNDYQKLRFVNNSESGKLWDKFIFKYLSEVNIRKAKPQGFDYFIQTQDSANNSTNPEFIIQ